MLMSFFRVSRGNAGDSLKRLPIAIVEEANLYLTTLLLYI